MLPTVTPNPTSGVAATQTPRVASELTALDALLFQPSGWFAISANNQHVPGVRAGTLQAALALVGTAPVATVVGYLASGVQAVDVDVTGPTANWIREDLTDWCTSRGRWHLVRPSGGAPGRIHFYVVAGDHAQDLADFCRELRKRYDASGTAIAYRDRNGALRPLSAPHRNGTHTLPDADLTESLAHLQAVLAQAPADAPAPVITAQHPDPAPAPRRRRALSSEWHNYLTQGTFPHLKNQHPDCTGPSQGACARCRIDHSRDVIEGHATLRLIRAGHTPASAWDLITNAHPTAMNKSRARGRAWWQEQLWDRATEQLNQTDPTAPIRTAAVRAAVDQARTRLTDLSWTLPTRQRTSLLLVGHHVLDRMTRNNTHRIPVPERNLVADTGIRDRKTIRAALRLLNATVGTLHTDTHDRQRRDTTSYEFEIPTTTTGVREIPPPSSYTPQIGSTWNLLPARCHSIHRALAAHPDGLTSQQTSTAASLTKTREAEPTPAEQRGTTNALIALPHAGLAHCTANGRWYALNEPTQEFAAQAAAAQKQLERTIHTERIEYRTHAHANIWIIGRRAAYQDLLARERAWWANQSPTERNARRQRLTRSYQNLPVTQKTLMTQRYALKRTIAGESEPQRHLAWINSHHPDAYNRRCADRRRWYDTLPEPLQIAHVRAWDEHRGRFGMSRLVPEHGFTSPAPQPAPDQLRPRPRGSVDVAPAS